MKLRSLLIIAVAVPAMLTSCLKSNDSLGLLADPGSISTGIFDRYYYGAAKTFALNGTPAIETLDLLDIRYSAPKQKAGAIHVVLAVDNSLVTAYNSANGTNYVALPANAYTFPDGLEFDFTAGNIGQHTLQMTLNKNNLNLQNAYAIGIKISSVSQGVIDDLQKSIIVTILVKNQWDGLYSLDFSNYHPSSNPNYDGATTDVEMRTTGSNKDKIYWPLAGAYAAPAVLGGGFSYFGVQEPEYTFNVNSPYDVTVQNVAAGATTFYTMNPHYNSHWVPATREIFAKWGYSYVAGDFAPGTSREWTQHFNYTGPR
jgi:hypothetical protein